MSFRGRAPLLSPSELAYFAGAANTGFAYTVGSGNFTNTNSSGSYLSIFSVNASGPETDNVYVGFDVGLVSGNVTAIFVGFALDATHYLTASPGSISDPGFLNEVVFAVNNGAGETRYTLPISPPIPYNTSSAFLTQYLSISGTVASVYAIDLNTGLLTFCASQDVSAIVSAATLQTWSAGGYFVGNGVTTTTIKNWVWGPNSDLLPVTVPNVVGEMQAAAEADIVAANLTVGTIIGAFNPAPAGQVISQSPAPGTLVNHATPVDIVVSAGSSDTTVPDLTNASISVVVPALLSAADLVIGTITYQASGVIIAGNVISQSPLAGDVVIVDTPVNVVVSSGLPALTVPDLFGLTQTDAINLLLSLGLVPGAIGSAPSKFVPPGEVQAQNPNAGAAVAVGTIVSFVLSQGIPAVGTLFDFEATVISQYANSPTILQLVNNLNQYIDQSANFANFFNFVWNVDTAVGFGLDIWGKIVGVSRLLQIPNTTDYVGFYQSSESQPAQDWTPAGSDQPPYNNPPVGGAFYTGHNATTAYLLPDDSYRQLILAKAFANIATTTAPAINQILQNLYGQGTAFVLNTGPMAISYNLTFTPTAIQLAILEQSGVIPTPPGVSVTINTNV
jgi:beta-lactam-binding protein with PASTA domain